MTKLEAWLELIEKYKKEDPGYYQEYAPIETFNKAIAVLEKLKEALENARFRLTMVAGQAGKNKEAEQLNFARHIMGEEAVNLKQALAIDPDKL